MAQRLKAGLRLQLDMLGEQNSVYGAAERAPAGSNAQPERLSSDELRNLWNRFGQTFFPED